MDKEEDGTVNFIRLIPLISKPGKENGVNLIYRFRCKNPKQKISKQNLAA